MSLSPADISCYVTFVLNTVLATPHQILISHHHIGVSLQQSHEINANYHID